LLHTSDGFILFKTNNGQQHQRIVTFTPQMRQFNYCREKETTSLYKFNTIPMVNIREYSNVKHVQRQFKQINYTNHHQHLSNTYDTHTHITSRVQYNYEAVVRNMYTIN
jgi:hypothetical protein